MATVADVRDDRALHGHDGHVLRDLDVHVALGPIGRVLGGHGDPVARDPNGHALHDLDDRARGDLFHLDHGQGRDLGRGQVRGLVGGDRCQEDFHGLVGADDFYLEDFLDPDDRVHDLADSVLAVVALAEVVELAVLAAVPVPAMDCLGPGDRVGQVDLVRDPAGFVSAAAELAEVVELVVLAAVPVPVVVAALVLVAVAELEQVAVAALALVAVAVLEQVVVAVLEQVAVAELEQVAVAELALVAVAVLEPVAAAALEPVAVVVLEQVAAVVVAEAAVAVVPVAVPVLEVAVAAALGPVAALLARKLYCYSEPKMRTELRLI